MHCRNCPATGSGRAATCSPWTRGRGRRTVGNMRRVPPPIVGVLLLLLVYGAIATADQRLTPLVTGWEQYFKLEWEAGERNGRPVVRGYIKNEAGMPAANVRLLVDGLDPSGQVVSQTVGWLGTQLTPGMRAYFEVPVNQRAPAYRVSVFAFDFIQHNGPRRRF